jgi:hypothetical protein
MRTSSKPRPTDVDTDFGQDDGRGSKRHGGQDLVRTRARSRTGKPSEGQEKPKDVTGMKQGWTVKRGIKALKV